RRWQIEREPRSRRSVLAARDHRHREIAHACGFYEGSHLNRQFKKFFRHSMAPVSEKSKIVGSSR
ncbi:MAG TPA: hypothetical protein VG897_14625, partial [Terriglobales bacterium]|nr:hypothetical protein [Terriglobales bacterium]